MNRLDLRICIVNYNTRELLRACLASIHAHPPPGEFEVVVVDNASRDGSVEMVRECFPDVHLIASPENLGYAAGNNLGLAGSRARYDLILNSDIEVHAGCLERLLRFMEAHPEAGMCGARLILPDGTIQPSVATELTLRKFATQQLLLDRTGLARYTFGEYWVDVSRVDRPLEVEQVTGACMFCRREAVDEVGPMDEQYWMYCEDSDWCLRFRARGWKLYYVPDATMLHVLGGSSRTTRAEMIAAYNHSAARYFYRNHGRLQGLVARLLGLTGSSLRLILWLAAACVTLGLVARFRRQVSLFAKTVLLTLLPRKRPAARGLATAAQISTQGGPGPAAR